MFGKVQQDSFQCLRIRISDEYEPSPSSGFGSPLSGSGFGSPASPGESLLPRDCQEGSVRFPFRCSDLQTTQQQPQRPSSAQQQQQPSSRYKTEMCRPFMEHGACKYGDKCQFAHGADELRSVNRHPKYKTDMCRTYHSVGFCPYGPRCHFIHALDEIRQQPAAAVEKKAGGGAVKQLPMFGGGGGSTWSFPDTREADMKQAVAQLNNFFNISGGRAGAALNSSGDSSRSGSFCSDLDSPTSASPPPSDAPLRLPIFSRLA